MVSSIIAVNDKGGKIIELQLVGLILSFLGLST
jgi:hypothetical protein